MLHLRRVSYLSGAIMAISKLPDPPRRSDAPADFTTKADAFLAAIPTFATEANALQTDVNGLLNQTTSAKNAASTSATNAENSAKSAAQQVTLATTQAQKAADSATNAQNFAAAAGSAAGLPALAGKGGYGLRVKDDASGVEFRPDLPSPAGKANQIVAVSADGTGFVAKALPITKGFVSDQQALTTNGLLTISHGLGEVPKVVTANLICAIATAGYSVGDVIDFPTSVGYNGTGMNVIKDATNLTIRFGSTLASTPIMNKSSGGVLTTISAPANWKLVVGAYA